MKFTDPSTWAFQSLTLLYKSTVKAFQSWEGFVSKNIPSGGYIPSTLDESNEPPPKDEKRTRVGKGWGPAGKVLKDEMENAEEML